MAAPGREHEHHADAWAQKHGGFRKGFADGIRKKLRELMQANVEDAWDALERIKEQKGVGVVPDAWAWGQEDHKDLLVCEVQLSSPINESKMHAYIELFWLLDSAYINLRLFIVDRCGIAREVNMFQHAYSHEAHPICFHPVAPTVSELPL